MSDLLTPREMDNLEKLIISAMTYDGQYPVDDVGEHAETIAKVLVFNGYRPAKLLKHRSRPELREEILVLLGYKNVGIGWFIYPNGYTRKGLPTEIDQLLLLYPDEEAIRLQITKEWEQKCKEFVAAETERILRIAMGCDILCNEEESKSSCPSCRMFWEALKGEAGVITETTSFAFFVR